MSGSTHPSGGVGVLCDGRHAGDGFKVRHQVGGAVAERPLVDDAPAPLHQAQLVEALQVSQRQLFCRAGGHVCFGGRL